MDPPQTNCSCTYILLRHSFGEVRETKLNSILVKWNTCCTHVFHRGLRIKTLLLFNQALLGVIVVICVRRKWFMEEGNRFKVSGEVRGPYRVGLWKHIRRGWDIFLRLVYLVFSIKFLFIKKMLAMALIFFFLAWFVEWWEYFKGEKSRYFSNCKR